MHPRNKIEYVLFDMDGLLIDSEKIYTIATNEVLAEYGKVMTWDIKAGCMGKPEIPAAQYLLSHFPDLPIDIDTFLKERNRIQDTLWPTVPLLPGAKRLVQHLKKHGIPIAVATSSRRRNFEMKSANLQDVFGLFEGKVICGDDKQYNMRGKPEPDIFLTAAQVCLGREVGDPQSVPNEEQLLEREKGLIFEDALPGMQAARRSGMSVIWVPDSNLLNLGYGPVTERADQILKSLEDFRPEEWGLPPFDDE
ncbi:hypothetical protein CVT24_004554 [Panaeolus cyanescens]|uniref:HAD-like protein n=1 Tax=Panaeolus cyanescens TaxID=181874 RepID=A0A409VCB9_9AGAR|nr:hypothetical protein CVT24_004554 [Panaeolus cyanescens]